MDVMTREALFSLRGPDGQVWELFEDGHITGFPDGTVVINRALPLMNVARGLLRARIGPTGGPKQGSIGPLPVWHAPGTVEP